MTDVSPAPMKSRTYAPMIRSSILYVYQICVTDSSPSVPFKHGINSLGEFGAAGLVHSAGINPDVLQPMASRESTAALDLCKSGFCPSSQRSVCLGTKPLLLPMYARVTSIGMTMTGGLCLRLKPKKATPKLI